MKKFANGTYKVRIKDITTGESSIKGTPFVEFTFSNEYRYIKERIYITGNGWKLLSLIYWKAGLDYRENSLEDLRGKILGIEVISGNYVNAFGAYKTYGKTGTFYSIEEYNILPEENYVNSEVDSYYDYEENNDDSARNYDYNDDTSLAEIFGVNIRDVASDMMKDPSEISDSDIMEYCGY